MHLGDGSTAFSQTAAQYGPTSSKKADPAPSPASTKSTIGPPSISRANPANEPPSPASSPSLSFSRFLLLMLAAMALSGLSYHFRTERLDLDPLPSAAFRATRMFLVYIICCIGLLMWRYRNCCEDFGLGRSIPKVHSFKDRRRSPTGLRLPSLIGSHLGQNHFLHSCLLGLAVYTVPLVAFIWFVGDPEFDRHFVDGKRDLGTGELLARTLLVFAMAAITDIWTRGFVLLQASRFKGDAFAIALQNVVWFVIHLYEIELLMDSWGLPLAIAVTLFIGIVGDMVVLRYRNVWGMALGHIYLNAVFVGYLAWF